MASNPSAYTGILPSSTLLPNGWNNQWNAAKALAKAGTGTAKIGIIGDSISAGQSAGTVTDCLKYGYVGRLDAALMPLFGVYAEGYMVAGCNPGTLNSPSDPYGNVALPGTTLRDGGIGFVFGTSTVGSTYVTINAPLHAVTGVAPISMDIFTIDFNTNSWQYSVDGGAAVTITPTNGTPPNGVNGTIGQGMMRRTSITFAGSTSHNVVVQQNGANALVFMGHVTYYGTTGLGIMRNATTGARAIDYATGGGSTAASDGGVSVTPDHIIPWSCLVPASTPASNNVSTGAGTGFPFGTGTGVDLGIIMLGGNDCTYGAGVEAFRKTITLMIHALRRANPPTATNPVGTSILICGEPYYSAYSDNQGTGVVGYEWQRYKDVLRDLAQSYNCGWIDLDVIFGETPVARGYSISGQVHPTQNGGGAGGGDGHLAIANAIQAVL